MKCCQLDENDSHSCQSVVFHFTRYCVNVLWPVLLWIHATFITTHKCGVVAFSVASVCVCLSVCNALTFESLDLESSFLVCRYIFRSSRSSLHIKVTGSGSRSQTKSVSVSCLWQSYLKMTTIINLKSITASP